MKYFIQIPTKGVIRGAYFGQDDFEENAPAAADLPNPRAVEAFIRLTHQRYYDALSRHFGKTICTKKWRLIGGKLTAHLEEIDRVATKMYDRLVAQLKARNGVTEGLKATNQMEWVRQMNGSIMRLTCFAS